MSTGPLGVTGTGKDGTISEAVAAGPGWLPVLSLGALCGGLLAQGTALLLAPVIGLSLGRTTASVGTLLGLWVLGVVLGVPFALRAVRSGLAVRACAVSASLTGCGLVTVAMATGPRLLVVGAVTAGLGSAVCLATQRGLLAALYPPLSLSHVLAAYRATALLTAGGALVVAMPAADSMGLSWRVGLLVLAAVLVVPAAFVSTVTEPGAGSFEQVVALRAAGVEVAADDPARMSFAEAIRRLLAIPSVRPLLALYALAALLGFGTVVYGGYAATQHADLADKALPGVLAAAGVVAAVVLLDRAGALARASRLAPAGLAAQGAVGFAVTGVGLAVTGLATWTPACLAGIVAAAAGLAVAVTAVDRLVALVVPSALRGAAGSVACGYEALLGIALGGAILSGLDRSFGLDAALPMLGAVAVVGALVLRSVGRQACRDLDASAGALSEAAVFIAEQRRGTRAPLLTCRGIDFAYGPLQILFGVDFTVDEGEMVALLGTNGAGKSTLLRVIAGLGTPSAGTVRLSGRDITFAEPGERVRSGVSQIPGGKAVFGPLTVAENLRLYGYALGRDKKAVDRGIEEAFETFPRLHERRNSPAATMSGGEQQMLALSKALILQPKLLLIDELSLGLAPKVVGELLVLVRSINAQGTAVVLVEQSVHVALSLAEHAYFMEKGQVRFDGRTADLLERPDILRSVFLSGVGKP
jgi:ABC-type branched-subunit amino acid transport system ATPase component